MDTDKRAFLARTLGPLLGVALVCAVLLLIADELARERIADNARREQLKIIDEVMTLPYDNDLYTDVIEVVDAAYLGSSGNVKVYRARRDGEPAGLVLMPVTARGYSGNIQLVIGIAYDGALTGVRVLSHRETEGLGDGIDQRKSNWITGFSGHSLDNTPPDGWAVTSAGGEFDQVSGATISSRGVINAVRNSLEYYRLNRDRLYLPQ